MVERAKVNVSGDMCLGAEHFSWGFHVGFGGPSPVTAAEVQTWAQAMADRISDAGSESWLGQQGTDTIYKNVSVQYYSGSGPATYSGAAIINPSVVGTSTPNVAPQVCRVISLLTGTAGRRFRGRIYLPARGALTGTDGISVPTAGSLTAFGLLLGDLVEAWPGDDAPYLGVYSAAADVVTPVTQLRQGNVLDTQRRRRDGLNETYSAVPFP